VHDALKYQGRWEGEADAVRKDGSLFSVFASMSMVSDDAGRPMYVMVSCIDISSEKAAEEELQQHNRYLGLINQIIGAAQTGATERVLIETLLNRTVDLLNIDGGLVSLVNPDKATVTIHLSAGFPQAFIQQLQALKTREEPFSSVFINGDVLHIPLDTDAARADERLQILLNEGFHCLLCVPIVTDRTIIGAIGLASRKIRSCSYEELQIFRSIGREFGSTITQVRLREELENTAREANLYIDILAHDINNINMAIRMYTELLLDSLDPDGTAAARKIIANVTQSAEILQNVTTIRRMHHESLQLRSVPLDPVIRDAVGQFSDGGKIVYDGCPSVVIADDMLPDIFRNLIVNAIKYGGPDVAIIIGVREEADEVTVSVEDTGPGIPDAMKEEIFSRFQNRKRGASGRGLGLYIVKSLVERYGGRVWADDRVPGSPEKGAAIRFTLRRP
jgi:signal transduction histidine kinase